MKTLLPPAAWQRICCISPTVMLHWSSVTTHLDRASFFSLQSGKS